MLCGVPVSELRMFSGVKGALRHVLLTEHPTQLSEYALLSLKMYRSMFAVNFEMIAYLSDFSRTNVIVEQYKLGLGAI